MTRRAILLTTALLACVPATPAHAKSVKARCDIHVKGAVKTTSKVVVYKRTDSNGNRKYSVCSRPAGPSALLGTTEFDDGEYGPNESTRRFLIAGTYVAAVVETGSADFVACSKFPGNACTPSSFFLRVIEAQSRRSVTIPMGPVAPRALLSPDGAVAWLQGPVLSATGFAPGPRRDLTVKPRELDRGTIPAASLRFRHGVLSWTRDGAAKSSRVL